MTLRSAAVLLALSSLLISAECSPQDREAIVAHWAAVPLPAGLETDWSVEATPLDRSASDLAADTAEHLDMARRLYDHILAVSAPRTIENTFVPYNEMLMHIDAVAQECSVLTAVHPDEALRDEAEAGEAQASRLGTELSLSVELYQALAALDLGRVDPVTRYTVEEELKDFRRAGVDQPKEVRDRIAALNDEITLLGQDWARNIADARGEIAVDPSALEGLAPDYVANHPAGDDGKVHIDTTYPDYIPFLTYAKDADARFALYKQYNNRAYPQNLEVLRKVIEKRYELAQLLGYDNYADFITSDKMVGSAANAREFIDKVKQASRAAADRDYGMLLARKQKDDPSATAVADWEKAYYGTLVETEQFDFDPREARPYFDFKRVRQGLFDITSKMFGVRYEQVHGLDLWNEDVTAWDVWEGDRLVGRFYLDLHPRANKYSHAACFGYREGVGGRRLPQEVLVCNFPDPADSEDGVALMEHGQVTTFFHEFGHLLHGLFGGHQPWIGVSGIRTEWDFVEAPSQMLEEWCFDRDALALFAKHYQTGEAIPAELVTNLKRAAEFGKGTGTAHQTFYGMLSLSYYDRPPSEVDLESMMVDLQSKYSPYPHIDGTHFEASFGHLFGYSAIYYTYKWSEVIAKDMFTRFQKEGLLNPATALDYRRKVLEPGGSRPAAELVRNFLGRPYSFEAFAKWLNSTAEPTPTRG